MTMGSELSVVDANEFIIEEQFDERLNTQWTLHKANRSDGMKLTVFRSCTTNKTLETCAKHMKVLRHPCMLRFIHCYKTRDSFCLVTESVTSLSSRLKSLTAAEISAGLFNILNALAFLHETCKMSHNNINVDSILIASDGSWKLGGLQRVKPFVPKTVNVEAGENKQIYQSSHENDMYDFGKLVMQFLEPVAVSGSVPEAAQFILRISQECANKITTPPQARVLMEDPIFKNELIEIRSFLHHLVLKSEDEKEEFFRSIVPRLRNLPLITVASNLTSLLLSRLILLNKSAEEFFLPIFLQPHCEEKGFPNGFFPVELYQQYLIPELLKIFCVHDYHVRLVLLKHFHNFVHLFSQEELKKIILPQVLVGIRDVDNQMVASSLRALAEIVPILGGTTVIGGQRCKMFSQGTPKNVLISKGNDVLTNREVTFIPENLTAVAQLPAASDSSATNPEVSEDSENVNDISSDDSASTPSEVLIPERSSPDGGESLHEDWNDWGEESEEIYSSPTSSETESLQTNAGAKNINSLGQEFDIMALDIKPVKSGDEIDYFTDMEPSISKVNEEAAASESQTKKANIVFDVMDDQEINGWDDTELDWTT